MFGMGLMMLLGLLLLAAVLGAAVYERESALRDGDPPARGRR